MIKLFDYILDLIYPPKCVFCGKVIDKSDICNDCIKTLPYTKGDSVYQRFPFVDKCISPLSASTTALYSLPCDLCTVSAHACSSSLSISKL